MERFKIDSMGIEVEKIEKNIFHLWIQYNAGKSQINNIINIENVHPGYHRIFTKRQLQILLKKLRGFKDGKNNTI